MKGGKIQRYNKLYVYYSKLCFSSYIRLLDKTYLIDK